MRRKVLLAILAFLLVAAVLLTAFGIDHTTLKRFTYVGFNRDAWQYPDQVIEALQIQPDDTVADLGSGGGYFTFRLADAVGPDGKVYAVDVDTGMIEFLERKAQEDGYPNVQTILAHYDDPLLPPGQVDLLFTSNTYHHLQDRVAYFRRVREYLAPGGRVAVIDFRGKGWFERWFGHWMAAEVIRQEMEQAGYRLVEAPEFLLRQHFLVFAVEAE